jgi:hypothetical protein
VAKGCDYSWERPTMSGLVAAGVTFAVRYVSHDTTGKNLTKGEADALRGSGIDVVTNWEYATDAALRGRSQGVSDAANAINMHVALGGPTDACIYFSVDFDAQDSDMRQVAAYIDGAASVIGYERTGVYGGYRVIANLAATNRCKYFWQTSAWSGGRWHPAAQLRQTDYHVPVGGSYIDIDMSMSDDFGAWGGPRGNAGIQPVTAGPWDPVGVFYSIGDTFRDASNAIYGFRSWIDALRNY